MKKLFFLIFILGLLFGEVASAEIVKLSCKFLSGEKDIGPPTFRIEKINNSEDAFISLDIAKQKVLETKSLYVGHSNAKWSDSEIYWNVYTLDNFILNISKVSLDRYTGKLFQEIFFKSGGVMKEFFQCSKIEKKF